MKKILAILLIGSLMIAMLLGCGKEKESAKDEKEVTPSVTIENNTEKLANESSADDGLETIETIGKMDVEKELFDVNITLPAEYASGTTQEELNAKQKEGDFKSATLNADGSITYVMSKSQHKKMMDEMALNCKKELDKMCGGEEYPNFVKIETNEDFTEFTITTKATELDFAESFSVLAFYMYGGMYNIFNGTEVDNIHVKFINVDSGEVISEANSKEMGE